jgi:hypothetical protein
MAKCKICRKKKPIYRDGQCFFCYQENQERKSREGKNIP